MKNNDFTHLHVHTEYSTLDGFGTPEAYARKAKKLGFKYLACTDHGNIDGLIKFQKACVDNGIKPILGSELYIVPEVSKDRKNGHILLLIKNNKGFKNLCRMLSFANTEGFYYKPRITYDLLLENCDGLIVSTACVQSFVTAHKSGKKLAKDLMQKLGDDFYFEIMPNNMKLQIRHNKKMLKMARLFKRKVILTNDCHYVNISDWKAQEVLLAIQRKALWTDENRFKFKIHGLHLKTYEQMKRSIKKIGNFKSEWMKNTIEIAEKCSHFQIPKRPVHLPQIQGIPPKAEARTLKKLCFLGYEQKFNKNIKNNKVYYNRFKEEYDLIKSKGFIRYFLIIKELVDWCKENGIMIGPRGSVGGCLIAYLLGITTIDPIKFNLIFSRFINEDRIDYPDIDIDFEHSKRHLVRKHLEDIYGEDHIAGISSFNRMKSKAIIRDVSRVFAVDKGEVDKFAKLIDSRVDDGIDDCIRDYSEGKEFKRNHPKVVKIAKKLEGQIKTRSQHAGGLIVSKQPLHKSNRGNLITMKGSTLINWEMNDTEHVGLMKLDALATRILSILAYTKELVYENKGFLIDYEFLSLEDEKVLEDISNGNTVGLFQLNTWAMTNLIKEMGVDNFKDIPAATALVRPGPSNSGMTSDYIKRKKTGEWERKHSEYEKITEDTFGVIVYQEQVMNVIHKIAGLPYSTADKIRKVIGKKRDVKEFAPYRKAFIKGCIKKGYLDKYEAIEFWKGLQAHAHYSFNLSHSVAYGLLGYWCAWAKHYYPTEFICASLTHAQKDKKPELIEEAYRLGLSLILPRINSPTKHNKWVAKDNKLYIPFTEVKGIGEKRALQAIGEVKQKQGTFWEDGRKAIKHKGAFGELLETIGAYRNTEEIKITPEIRSYFDFRIVTNPRNHYAKLYQLFDNEIKLAQLDPVLQGDTRIIKKILHKKLLKKVKFKGLNKFNTSLSDCEKCELREECTEPVLPSIGKHNISIIGEAPGFEEDRDGIGFIGRSGGKIWEPLEKKGYTRDIFHVTNINKCYPQESRTPNAKQIKACSKWIRRELKRVNPILILAFGNACNQFFAGRKTGIQGLSGKVEWSEKYGAWIVWCIHPAATLHNPDNVGYYKSGMKSFIKMLKIIQKAN